MESMFIAFMIAIIFLGVIGIIGQLEIFSKAGYKWWLGLIPFYSTWVLITKIAKMAPIWFILNFVNVIVSSLVDNATLQTSFVVFDYFVTFCICYNLAKVFGKKPVSNGIIGALFNGIWLICLGLDKKAVYDDNAVVSQHGPFGA